MKNASKIQRHHETTDSLKDIRGYGKGAGSSIRARSREQVIHICHSYLCSIVGAGEQHTILIIAGEKHRFMKISIGKWISSSSMFPWCADNETYRFRDSQTGNTPTSEIHGKLPANKLHHKTTVLCLHLQLSKKLLIIIAQEKSPVYQIIWGNITPCSMLGR